MIQHSFSTFIILITTRLSQHGPSIGSIIPHQSSIFLQEAQLSNIGVQYSSKEIQFSPYNVKPT